MRNVLLSLLVCILPLVAQGEEFSFIRLGEEQGLTTRRCFSVAQDRHGFIWISNKFSVNRYDGTSFVNYSLPQSPKHDSENINENEVRMNAFGELILFSKAGAVYVYDEAKDAFELLYTIRDFFSGYNTVLYDVHFESAESLLLGTSAGVLRYHRATKQSVPIVGLERMEVQQFLRVGERMFLATTDGLREVLMNSGGSCKVLHHWLEGVFVNYCYYDAPMRRMLVGTFVNGLYEVNESAGSEPTRVVNTGKAVRDIILYSPTQVAVGVDGEGILFLNRTTLQVERSVRSADGNVHSLSANSVYDLFLDFHGTLWVATYHCGISMLDRSKQKFTRYTHEKGNVHSLTDNCVNSVCEDAEGDVWFGTNNGVSLLRRKSGTWSHFLNDTKGENGNVVLAVCADAQQRVWAGCYSTGAVCIDKRTGRVERYQAVMKNPIVGTDFIYSILTDRYTGCVWMGGMYGKLSCYNPTNGTTRFYDVEKLRCMAHLNDSTLLVGLWSGLYQLNVHTGKLSDPIVKGSVNAIQPDGADWFWVGMIAAGLNRVNVATNERIIYRKREGLSSNHVHAILKDDDGCLWVSTEDGLNKFDPLTSRFALYDRHDGTVSDQYIPTAAFRCMNGDLLFGSVDGALSFSPAAIERQAAKDFFHLYFDSFYLFGEKMLPSAPDSPLKAGFNDAKGITLEHNRNYFSIHFMVPNYQMANKIDYAYRLEGYDGDWSRPSTAGVATYTKVSPGNYLFKARAYVDGMLIDERQMRVVVRQPWWNSWVAWLVYGLLFVGSTYSVIRALKEKRKRKQTQEKIDFFINTAHDLRSPLNQIEAPLKEINHMASLSAEVRSLLFPAIENTKKLSYFVSQLLDFQRIALNTETLVIGSHHMAGLLQGKINAYRSITSQKFITLDLQLPEEERPLLFDKEKVSRILDNLLSNAVKYTPFGGMIQVRFAQEEQSWTLAIKDSGIGIPSRYTHLVLRHIFRIDNPINEKEVGSGIGLKMVKSLVRLHEGTVTFTSKEGVGTEFVLTFPYQYAHAVVEPERPTSLTVGTEEPNPSDIRILLLENEPAGSSYLYTTLVRNFCVEAVESAHEAFARVVAFHPELIIADMTLEDMDGCTFARKIRENTNTSSIPVMLVSGIGGDELLRAGLQAGAVDFLCKPFEVEALKCKIVNLVQIERAWKSKGLEELKVTNIASLNNERDQRFMEKVMCLIDENMDNSELNINFLCRSLGLSRTLLYNNISQITGKSPNEFINACRLKKAAALIVAGELTVAEIAYEVGFSTPKYFSRVFKEFYGVSPKDYARG